MATGTFHSLLSPLANLSKKRPPLLRQHRPVSTHRATGVMMSVSAYFFLRVAFFFLPAFLFFLFAAFFTAFFLAAFLRLFLAMDVTSFLLV